MGIVGSLYHFIVLIYNLFGQQQIPSTLQHRNNPNSSILGTMVSRARLSEEPSYGYGPRALNTQAFGCSLAERSLLGEAGLDQGW